MDDDVTIMDLALAWQDHCYDQYNHFMHTQDEDAGEAWLKEAKLAEAVITKEIKNG